MANSLWAGFISFLRRLLLGDPSYRYAPTSLTHVLNSRFNSQTHHAYLLPGAILGRLLYLGQRSIIFHPIADSKLDSTQELSLTELFEKCHQEFILEFFLKSKHYDYLIFPLAMQKRGHWATLVYDVAQQNLMLIDSSSSLISVYDNQEILVEELRNIFAKYDLMIHSFNYVFQGFQKDNVHCGAWTLANIIAVDTFGIAEYIEKIEGFYHQYLDPKELAKTVHQETELLEDDFVIIEHSDLEERFEEVAQLKSEEDIQEISFKLSFDAFLPNIEIIKGWEQAILHRLAHHIDSETFILNALILRDNVQYQQTSLRKFAIEHINFTQLIEDIESRQGSYRIKDPGRQRQRFEALGYANWINSQTLSLQVIFEALLHDACSFEPMMQILFSKCHWLNSFGMLEGYLELIKIIEQRISGKVIEFLVRAEQDNRFAWIKEKKPVAEDDLLDWFPKLLVLKADLFIGSKFLLEMVDDIKQRFDDITAERVVLSI